MSILTIKVSKDTTFVSSELRACRACLKTECKLYMLSGEVAKAFTDFTGAPVLPTDDYPKYLCHICMVLLRKFYKFHARCLQTLNSMIKLASLNCLVMDNINEINKSGVTNHLSQTPIETDTYNPAADPYLASNKVGNVPTLGNVQTTLIVNNQAFISNIPGQSVVQPNIPVVFSNYIPVNPLVVPYQLINNNSITENSVGPFNNQDVIGKDGSVDTFNNQEVIAEDGIKKEIDDGTPYNETDVSFTFTHNVIAKDGTLEDGIKKEIDDRTPHNDQEVIGKSGIQDEINTEIDDRPQFNEKNVSKFPVELAIETKEEIIAKNEVKDEEMSLLNAAVEQENSVDKARSVARSVNNTANNNTSVSNNDLDDHNTTVLEIITDVGSSDIVNELKVETDIIKEENLIHPIDDDDPTTQTSNDLTEADIVENSEVLDLCSSSSSSSSSSDSESSDDSSSDDNEESCVISDDEETETNKDNPSSSDRINAIDIEQIMVNEVDLTKQDDDDEPLMIDSSETSTKQNTKANPNGNKTKEIGTNDKQTPQIETTIVNEVDLTGDDAKENTEVDLTDEDGKESTAQDKRCNNSDVKEENDIVKEENLVHPIEDDDDTAQISKDLTVSHSKGNSSCEGDGNSVPSQEVTDKSSNGSNQEPTSSVQSKPAKATTRVYEGVNVFEDDSSDSGDLPDCLVGISRDIYKKDIRKGFPEYKVRKPKKPLKRKATKQPAEEIKNRMLKEIEEKKMRMINEIQEKWKIKPKRVRKKRFAEEGGKNTTTNKLVVRRKLGDVHASGNAEEKKKRMLEEIEERRKTRRVIKRKLTDEHEEKNKKMTNKIVNKRKLIDEHASKTKVRKKGNKTI